MKNSGKTSTLEKVNREKVTLKKVSTLEKINRERVTLRTGQCLIVLAVLIGLMTRLVAVFQYVTFDIGPDPDQIRDAFAVTLILLSLKKR